MTVTSHLVSFFERSKKFPGAGQLLVSFGIAFTLVGCTGKKTELAWDRDLFVIGSQSSPRVADLNGDGVLDIVMGAGKNEYQHSKQGILAFNGADGTVLWQQESPDQVYGSATFYDVNADGVSDVFIGGRSPHFKALDGKTGSVLWEYEYSYQDDAVLRHARFNFNSSVLVPDQDHDGLPDLLTVNGGNSKAAPGSAADRFPGVLMVLSSRTGEVLAADTMPDGGESYMSPICFSHPGKKDQYIVFGTGGETMDGRLYLASLTDLMQKKLANSQVIATDSGHGFIAPPVVADVTGDGTYDIIAISHGSKVVAINGADQSVLWQSRIEGTESSNSFAVGFFTDDEVPDFFTFVSKGQWPDNTGSLQVLFDGKTGKIAYIDSLGCTGFSSPVVYDLNGDGRDEAIISINEFDCSTGFAGKKSSDILNKLLVVDFKNGRLSTIDQLAGFKNIFSTPWIGDIDGDGYLDIIHCQYYSPSPDLMTFLGMRIKRISTHIKMKEPPAWGAYMGSRGDGVFVRE